MIGTDLKFWREKFCTTDQKEENRTYDAFFFVSFQIFLPKKLSMRRKHLRYAVRKVLEHDCDHVSQGYTCIPCLAFEILSRQTFHNIEERDKICVTFEWKILLITLHSQ